MPVFARLCLLVSFGIAAHGYLAPLPLGWTESDRAMSGTLACTIALILLIDWTAK